MTFEKVEVNTWKPISDKESIEGIFVKAEKDVGQNNSMLYSIEVEGKPMAVWGSAVLDPKMNAVRPGDLIKIEYLGKGEAKAGHNAPKMFDVYIDYEHRDKLMAQAEAAAQAATPAVPAQVEAQAVPAPVPVPIAQAVPRIEPIQAAPAQAQVTPQA